MGSSVSSSSGEYTTPELRQLQDELIQDEIRFWRELRQPLLQDPNFRLLKVEHGEVKIDDYRKEIKSLTVVTPATDPTIAEDVQRKGWYCLSHLWGDPLEWIDWDDAGVVDGDTDAFIKLKVHPDKRDMIMPFLQFLSGYWWIDIFCAQSDTPLGIMGDIYKFCHWCFGFVDVPCETCDDADYNLFQNIAGLSCRYLEQTTDGYLDVITKTHHKDDVFTEWTQVLKDLLHWPSTHFEEMANEELIRWKNRYSKKPRVQQFLYSLMQHPVDERIAAVQKFFNSKEYVPDDFFVRDRKFMECLQACTPENLISAQQGAANFPNCRWMNRVWTLQELALPSTMDLYSGASSFPFGMWKMHFVTFLKVITKAYEIRDTTSMDRQSNRERGTVSQTPRQVLDYYQTTDPVLARIYSDYRKVLEVAIVMKYVPHLSTRKEKNDNFLKRIILNSFATSQRKALYPEDYVYGVLGILDVSIPRLKDRDETWLPVELL